MATKPPVRKNVPSAPSSREMLGKNLRGSVERGGRREHRSPFGFRVPRLVLRPHRPRSPATRLSGVSRPSQGLHRAFRPPRGVPYAPPSPTEPYKARYIIWITKGAERVLAILRPQKPLKTT